MDLIFNYFLLLVFICALAVSIFLALKGIKLV